MSTSVCSICNGSGRKTCPECGGNGTLLSPIKHDHQDGDINDGDGDMVMCTKCGGAGEVQCEVCGGTGQVHEDDIKIV